MRQESALRALQRFGLGARPGEAASIDDPRGWLHSQLDEPDATPFDARDLPSARELAELLHRRREAQRTNNAPVVEEVRRAIRQVTQREVLTCLHHRIHTELPFVERLVAFWSNHLCVSMAGKATVAPLAGWYERDAIRPHVLGRFENMVLASARHPAMLLYLDNAASTGPNSWAGRHAARRGRKRGLNENYARELLELHTLGVDGGYDQRDVEEMARMLTGWTVDGLGRQERGGEPGFVFRPPLHEPGDKVLLGRRYRESGEEEARRAIIDLCRHPSTARFLATKLARHFVADDPPPVAVHALESVFRESDGDLREVARALVEIDAAWDPVFRKFRTPQDWLVAVLRFAPPAQLPETAAPALRQLRHPVWAPAAPKGFEDTFAAWADPDGLMNRAELARPLARYLHRQGRRADELLEVLPIEAQADLRNVLDPRAPGRDQIALAIGGPAFQWR